jgi:hypothetical protein
MSFEKLINGQKLTTEDRSLWLGYLPLPPLNLEISIFYNKDVELGGLKIWNYNKSIIDYTKCVKEIQALINGEIHWEGAL